MPSGITRARVTSCCSLVIGISATSRSLFNAGSDWVGSCAITIKRRRDRTPKGSIPELRSCAMRLGDRGSRFATRRPNSALRQARPPCEVQVLPPFQYFDHTGARVVSLRSTPRAPLRRYLSENRAEEVQEAGNLHIRVREG